MKKILCLLLCLLLFLPVLSLAESNLDDFLVEDDEDEYTDPVIVGEVYPEKTREDFNMNSPALYKGKISGRYDNATAGAVTAIARGVAMALAQHAPRLDQHP